ncbi:MAG: GTP pyrophosphokinase [Lachnospiraceae bacterium]
MSDKELKKQEKKLREEIEKKKILEEYQQAMTIVSAHLKTLAAELSQKYDREIAEYTTSRIKTPESIIRKLRHKGYPISARHAVEHLNDIAGVRIVCDYTDDVYALRDGICKWKDIHVVKEKDFIKKPKKSGYRSLHIITEVPLPSAQSEKPVRVEIQLRTVIMDFWARLDHRTRYKQALAHDPELFRELNECAVLGKHVDDKMLSTRKLIEQKKPEKRIEK